MKTGKNLLLINKYTYSYNNPYGGGGERWMCSMRVSRKCGAYVRTKDDQIMDIRGTHTDEPPRYHITDSGEYIKV